MLSHVQLFATPWTVAHQAPLSMGFSRQEYWSGLPFPTPGDLLILGSNLHLLHWQVDSLLLHHLGSSKYSWNGSIIVTIILIRSSSNTIIILWMLTESCKAGGFSEDEKSLFLFFLYCSGFCHILKWNSHGFTCVPHPNPPSHLPLHPIPLGLPSAPGLSACLIHPTWAGDLFHPR